MSELRETIESLFAEGDKADKALARSAFFRLQRALGHGEVRAAEPDSASPTGWRVNAWVKQGILLGFRFGDTADMSSDHGKWPFFDKDTMTVKRPGLEGGFRIGHPRLQLRRRAGPGLRANNGPTDRSVTHQERHVGPERPFLHTIEELPKRSPRRFDAVRSQGQVDEIATRAACRRTGPQDIEQTRQRSTAEIGHAKTA